MRHQDRVALITGGASGIGAATARWLAREGAAVIVSDVNATGAEQVAAQIEGMGRRARATGGDVASRAQVEAMVEAAVDSFGRLDILVTCAGTFSDNLIHKMTEEQWRRVVDVHLTGTFLCSQAAQRVMVPQRYGRIVTMSSITAFGSAASANYSAAKAGIQGLTRTLALELGRFGITANCVAPGFIATALTHRLAEQMGVAFDTLSKQYGEQVAVRRIGEADDVANAVSFLADEASGFINGEVLHVCGGPRGGGIV